MLKRGAFEKLAVPGTLAAPGKLTAAATALTMVAMLVPGTARADQIRDQEQPWLDALNIGRAWSVTRGHGVTVAVVDSGVDADQQDLTGSVATGPDYAEGANPPGVPAKRLHGTNMASIIAGHGHGPGSTAGVIGVAPEARLLSVRVILEKDEPGYAAYSTDERFKDTIPKGIRYSVDHGVDVINLSLGRKQPSSKEREAVAYAISKGVVVVASAGNDGESGTGPTPYSYPASYPGVISVAAVDAARRHASFSDRNSAVVVSAPGVRIVGAGPGDTYWLGDGTSPAAAFVSGTAALIRARYPRLAPALVAQAIVESTTARPRSGYDAAIGFGEVDVAAALDAAGRRVGYRMSGAGMNARRRFVTGDLPPIQVVHRDRALLATYSGIGTAAMLGLFGTTIALLVRRRRRIAPPPQPWNPYVRFDE